MKVGMLTFHNVDNYGAVLQAYALQKTIKNIENNTEIIDYENAYIIKQYKVIQIETKGIKNFIKSIIRTLLKLVCGYWISKKRFIEFREKYLCISNKKIFSSKNIFDYDIYIVGSDQVWNSDITKSDKTFLLDVANKECKKIAYGASIGQDIITEKQYKYLEGVDKFDYVSVREDSAVKILKEVTNKEVVQVLDPTLLADKKIWNDLMKSNKYGKYVLVYRMSLNDEVLKIAEKISARLGTKIINISLSLRMNKFGVRNLMNKGPEDFVTLFKNAEFIVTNSFHGLAFSVIFNKNFIVVPHKTKGTRMRSLVKLLSLEDRLIINANEINQKFKVQIDYTIPNQLLEKEKEKSFKFLKNAIQH